MRVTFEVELTDEEERAIRTCSIERVIRTSERLVGDEEPDDARREDLREMNLGDWGVCASPVEKLWSAARSAIFEAKRAAQT